MLMEAERAENVVLVIPAFSAFIKSATTIGVDVLTLIVPFIHSPFIHIVGLDSKKDYYDFLGNKSTITENFEMIATDNGDDGSLILMLIEETEELESKGNIMITYPALLAIVDSAKKYFEEALKATKSKEILIETVGLVLNQGRKIVLKSDVMSLVEVETGIPTTAAIWAAWRTSSSCLTRMSSDCRKLTGTRRAAASATYRPNSPSLRACAT